MARGSLIGIGILYAPNGDIDADNRDSERFCTDPCLSITSTCSTSRLSPSSLPLESFFSGFALSHRFRLIWMARVSLVLFFC